jgi:phage terminase small subunit
VAKKPGPKPKSGVKKGRPNGGLLPSEKAAGMLSPRERAFVNSYKIHRQGAKAYREAFNESNYSYARVCAHNFMRRPHVAKAIADYLDLQDNITELKAQDIVDEMRNLAMSNYGDYAVWDHNGASVVPSENLTRAQLAAVSEVKIKNPTRELVLDAEGNPVLDAEGNPVFVESGGEVNLKLYDKHKALVELGRHVGVFKQFNVPDPEDEAPAIDVDNIRTSLLERMKAIGKRLTMERVTERIVVEDAEDSHVLPTGPRTNGH